ncbi:hypothetical protein C8J56DRAFT_1003717 [Mycena floridula]|nr:hypothetical protein C8J56DRAFT_1004924 [Mycena floridula]KAJ7591124.1 hypothetical protein C8J56DRAFT_1003717 [Mycena floridula]
MDSRVSARIRHVPLVILSQQVIDTFRSHYQRFINQLDNVLVNPTDSYHIIRIGEDLDEFSSIVTEFGYFLDPNELEQLKTNIVQMQSDLRLRYAERSTSSIAHFFNVGRTTVRRLLLEYGIAQPGAAPNTIAQNAEVVDPNTQEDDDVNDENQDEVNLDPILEESLHPVVPQHLQYPAPRAGYLSNISDAELDKLILFLRSHYVRAGVSMLDGMLRRLGHRVQARRIRESLLRIDPVHRIFDRIRIRRRGYTVPGPNALWHHDGQHDCRSVHNVRIERLWVDVTTQIGDTWHRLFDMLELRYGLNINNQNHIWLLQHLFLPTINIQLDFFAQSWNNHRIQIRNGPNRSPLDMFVFDMLALGVRGQALELSPEELESYGIDWAAFNIERVRRHQQTHIPPNEESSSWIGHQGPPPNLTQVVVEPPETVFAEEVLPGLDDFVREWTGSSDITAVASAWVNGLAYARRFYPDDF